MSTVRGTMTGHPAVITEAARPASTRPELRRRDGIPIVVYRRTRVFVDRNAWEMVPEDGVLIMQVHPHGEPAYALAFTPTELESVFGHVRTTKSWDTVRHYHFPGTPAVVSACRVAEAASAPAPAPATSTITAPATNATSTTTAATNHELDSSTITPTRSARRRWNIDLTPVTARSLHEWAATWCARIGVPVESEPYLEAVSAWRRVWRPDRVKVLLVAESHVAEAPGDQRTRVNSPPWIDRDLPVQFVRLVYCLGYGESSLCAAPKPTGNAGTLQFWDLFGQIALGHGAHNRQPRNAMSTLDARIRWKVEVLQRLQARGVWLEDTSPIGIYKPGGGRILPSGSRLYRALLRDAFDQYIWPGVANDEPEQVWVIGAGVATALTGLRGITPERWISQPQAARSAEQRQRFEQDLAAMCGAIARITP